MTNRQLDILIERYFNGETSLIEERQLINELMDTRHNSPMANEARAVLGYSIATSRITNSRRSHKTYPRIAAAVAIIAITTVSLLTAFQYNHIRNTDASIAYINGKKITDTDIIMQMMFDSLSSVADATDETNDMTTNGLIDIVMPMENNSPINL